ncbi:ShlB/FhaC/HecB family hemolysin secretion/activation protein [Shewanella sp. UCD-KL12]|uniref:ShlB/FhaC/HecB family hemolysin secretion/activation protein n=1 Tax=Shewanella sp. UCD-KL12 TaxID=1917163 RepID=UPI00097133FA|nr:ShlB/FhaC/HecB family hemolysin secretion/activation protein [Shewanella sp. UCD-KL12]
MSKSWRSLVIFVFVLSTLFSISSGYVFAKTTNDHHEKLIKQGMTRVENKITPLINKQDIFIDVTEAEQELKQTVESDGPCFDISDITIEGVTVFGELAIEGVAQKYNHRCLSLTIINQLVTEISDHYIANGYITSRAYIKPQDLSSGQLVIVVVEGYLQSILASEQTLTDRQLAMSFPIENGNVLNLRDIEQGLENLNRLGQNQATTALSPGDSQGSSVVVVNNHISPSWRGSLSVSNTGIEETGLYQLDGYLIYDNLFGLNDSLITSFSSNIGEHDLPESKSRSYSLIGNIPYGYWFFSVNGTYFEYGQTVLGNVVNFFTHGSSLNTSAKVEHMLYRGERDKINVAASFVRKENKNYIEDVYLETSSRTLYIWQVSADYTRYFNFGSFNGRAQIDHSVPWFDASTNLVEAELDYQFTKYQLDLSFSTSFELGAQYIQYLSSIHLLSSPAEILTSEGLSVGGRYSVRGIANDSLFGYHGGYLRNDFNTPINVSWLNPVNLSLFAGVDVGISNLPEYPDLESEWMAGAIAGFRGSYRNINLSASYARALRMPDILNAEDYVFDITVGINF